MSADVKSTGQLLDETATLGLRHGHCEGPDTAAILARLNALSEALGRRLGGEVGPLVFDLATVLCATWMAQEVVMADRDDVTTARAARQAQRLNAHRSRLIRRIDQLLGESGITVFVKSYDRGVSG